MCGNYFAIKLTVYIYAVPKAVIFMRTEKPKKKEGKLPYQILPSFKPKG